jgi:hypothetical protein
LVIRATDAKEVGVENPAEETFCYPNHTDFRIRSDLVKDELLQGIPCMKAGASPGREKCAMNNEQ